MPEECKFNPLVNLLLDRYDVLAEPRWMRPLCSFSYTHFPSFVVPEKVMICEKNTI